MNQAKIRDILRANMFDGCDGGIITMATSTLLDDVSEILALHLATEPKEAQRSHEAPHAFVSDRPRENCETCGLPRSHHDSADQRDLCDGHTAPSSKAPTAHDAFSTWLREYLPGCRDSYTNQQMQAAFGEGMRFRAAQLSAIAAPTWREVQYDETEWSSEPREGEVYWHSSTSFTVMTRGRLWRIDLPPFPASATTDGTTKP